MMNAAPTGFSKSEMFHMSATGLMALTGVASVVIAVRAQPKQKQIEVLANKVAEHDARIGRVEGDLAGLKNNTDELLKLARAKAGVPVTA